ncbi:MAG: FAD-dependent monooxygenase [Vulcanimicrobiaceae bacterium]|jgi:flavin-dependent dehydrogenase
MKPDNERVIVVGAGPSGAATALALARASIPVTLIERTAFPRRKVCGEYLGMGAVAALDALGLGEQVRALGSALRGIRIVTGGAHVELAFSRPAIGLARATLDNLILEAALGAGAQLVSGRVEDVFSRGVAVRDASGERVRLQGRFVVGADGVGSIVARKLGLTLPLPSRPRFAVGGHFRGIEGTNGCLEMYCDGKTYLAINPLGDGIANVMAVAPKDRLETWSRVMEFAAEARSGPRVAVGPLVHDVRRTIAPGAMLVGDAAGFLSPFTGQGVFLALRSAQSASAALIRAFEDARAEDDALAAYDREQRKELRARTRLGKVIDALIAVPFLARRSARKLEASPALAAILLDAVAGSTSAGTALRPAVLRRLLA